MCDQPKTKQHKNKQQNNNNNKNNSLTHSVNPLRSRWSRRRQQSSSIPAGLRQATGVHSSSSLLPPSLPHLSVSRYPPSGLPLPLFPGGAHVSAAYRWRSFFMRSTWPSHFQRLFFTSWTMSLMPARFRTSQSMASSPHQMRRILLRHLPSKPLTLLSNLLSVLQVCAACSRTERTLDL